MNSFPYPEVDPTKLRIGNIAYVCDSHTTEWMRVLHIDDQDDITGVTVDGLEVSFRPEHVRYARRGLCAEDYRRALRSQDASNGVALTLSLADVIPLILSEAYFTNEGTDWVMQHPITRLYILQIATLSSNTISMLPSDYDDLIKECERQISILDPDSNTQEHEQPTTQ